jgi:hypothetical protein
MPVPGVFYSPMTGLETELMSMSVVAGSFPRRILDGGCSAVQTAAGCHFEWATRGRYEKDPANIGSQKCVPSEHISD